MTRIPAADLALASAFAVVGFAEAFLGLTIPAEPAALAATAILVAAPLTVRRAHPFAVLVSVLLVQLVQAGLGSGLPGGLSGFLTTALAVYTAAASAGSRRALGALAASAVGVGAVVAVSGDARPGNFVYAGCVVLAAWLAGRAVRLTGERSALLAERTAMQERSRIAAELHDVVSHHVTAIVVRASAERRSMGDTPAARVLSDVERDGRETLQELRRLLGVLRVDDGSAVPVAPQPGLTELGELVRGSAARGVPATLSVEGEERGVGDGLALVVYRVVQESLTNAAKHLVSARADIRLRWGPDRLAVEVLSRGSSSARPGSASPGGYGLKGMAERVAAYGGVLDAGATDGGFRVHASFPLEGP